MSPQLDAMVRGCVQRSYLKTDGWWADFVLERFGFLSDYGFEVDLVMFWIEEHTVRYSSDHWTLNLQYSRDGVCSSLIIPLDGEAIGIDDVLEESLPALRRPPLEPFGKRTVTERIAYWADGIERIAPELFGPPASAHPGPQGR